VHPVCGDLQPIIDHSGFEVEALRRHTIDPAAAKAESDRADVAVRFGVLQDKLHRRDCRRDNVLGVSSTVKLARFVLVRGRAAGHGQQVRSEG
jgi:hypothetical protein